VQQGQDQGSPRLPPQTTFCSKIPQEVALRLLGLRALQVFLHGGEKGTLGWRAPFGLPRRVGPGSLRNVVRGPPGDRPATTDARGRAISPYGVGRAPSRSSWRPSALVLLASLWAAWERHREHAADDYAARLGQADVLAAFLEREQFFDVAVPLPRRAHPPLHRATPRAAPGLLLHRRRLRPAPPNGATCALRCTHQPRPARRGREFRVRPGRSRTGRPRRPQGEDRSP
jgi:hypothetical protein